MEMKGDLGHFEHGSGCSEYFRNWWFTDFPTEPCLRFTEGGLSKYPVSSSSMGENASLVP